MQHAVVLTHQHDFAPTQLQTTRIAITLLYTSHNLAVTQYAVALTQIYMTQHITVTQHTVALLNNNIQRLDIEIFFAKTKTTKVVKVKVRIGGDNLKKN